MATARLDLRLDEEIKAKAGGCQGSCRLNLCAGLLSLRMSRSLRVKPSLLEAPSCG